MGNVSRRTPFGRRPGVSLVEVLVVMAVMAVLLGLLLGAVQNARRAAQRTKNINNLRQIVLATHHWASANGDRLPPAFVRDPPGVGGPSLFSQILPHVDQEAAYREREISGKPYRIPIYVNPEDPSVDLSNLPIAAVSYGANFQLVFDGPRVATITDGTSNTIAFAEHYAQCSFDSFNYTTTIYVQEMTHRATFAETFKVFATMNPLPFGVSEDICPVTSGSPPTSVGSLRGYTFQAAPALKECSPLLAQSPNPAGMEVALADGSVRLIRAGVAETVYWGLVTPRGGEAITDY